MRMANTFSAAPDEAHERSTATVEVTDPQSVLERIIEEAGKHRGTLREQDGFTIPFREGGSVRVRLAHEEGADTGTLSLSADAPTVERREHVERTVGELVGQLLGAEAGALTWQPA